jgi:hypothetical protein
MIAENVNRQPINSDWIESLPQFKCDWIARRQRKGLLLTKEAQEATQERLALAQAAQQVAQEEARQAFQLALLKMMGGQ